MFIQNITGRVGSDQEVRRFSSVTGRAGSQTRPARSNLTREKPCFFFGGGGGGGAVLLHGMSFVRVANATWLALPIKKRVAPRVCGVFSRNRKHGSTASSLGHSFSRCRTSCLLLLLLFWVALKSIDEVTQALAGNSVTAVLVSSKSRVSK